MDEDEDGDGNFEIVSPVKAATHYSVFVDGQTRNEMGDYGLKVEFRVADRLRYCRRGTSDTGITRRPDEMLQFGRADYFFFTAPDNAGYRFPDRRDREARWMSQGRRTPQERSFQPRAW